MAQGPPPLKETRWKTRQPKDNIELKKWRKACFTSLREGNPLAGLPEENSLASLPEGNSLIENPSIESIQ
jgi:hypothetical protein